MSIFKTALLGCIISAVAAAGSPSWLEPVQRGGGGRGGGGRPGGAPHGGGVPHGGVPRGGGMQRGPAIHGQPGPRGGGMQRGPAIHGQPGPSYGRRYGGYYGPGRGYYGRGYYGRYRGYYGPYGYYYSPYRYYYPYSYYYPYYYPYYYGPYAYYYSPYSYGLGGYYYGGGLYIGGGLLFGDDGYSYSGDGYYTGPYSPYGEGTPAVIGRVLSDLSGPTYSYYSDQDRKNIAKAREDVEKFNENWQRGHFNKGQLDDAISRLDDLAKSDQLHPTTRAMYARDRDDLRTFRETRGQYAYVR